VLGDARLLIGCSDSGSLPSNHAANWFAATLITFVFYRRSWWFMLPIAATISFSRVYDGVHYPGDVLAGAVLGAGCAGATLVGVNGLWRSIGRKWFPLWWEKVPSLVNAECGARNAEQEIPHSSLPVSQSADAHWLRLGYLLIAGLLAFRLWYIGSNIIELSHDEAYQWLWSKHLALSYYSKPPGIALIQFAGTRLWGDTQFGVRFFSPVFAAVLSLAVLRFFAREAGARQGFLLLLIVTSVPLLSAGSILMTIDPPLVLSWTLAMIVGWRAVQPGGSTRQWILAGLAAGLGFLCKYSAAYLIICWAVFFVLWPPARVHLKKPGPYLGLLIFALCTLPVVIWNAEHRWITVQHVSENAGLNVQWQPTLRYFWEFLGLQALLLNPVFFVPAVWAMMAFWKRRRENPLELYFFCMGPLVFLGHWIYSLRSQVLANWVGPALVPMYCLMVLDWDARWRAGCRAVKGWLVGGLIFGFVAVAMMHQTDLIGKITGRPLPGDVDPLRRVRGYRATAAFVEQAREKLEQDGKPAFIICDHYDKTGEFSFYLPQARAALSTGQPLVYYRTSNRPENQFYFWPEYRYVDRRKGDNAIYVTELAVARLESGWLWKWLAGEEVHIAKEQPPGRVPPFLLQEFDSVTDLGAHEIKVGGRIYKRVQLFECRNLH
jgi:hypothetical protein